IGVLLPFAPARSWTVTAAGEVVATTGKRYAVDVHRAGGTVLRIERAVRPVPVTPEERAAEEDRVTRSFRRHVPGWRWDGPAIPSTKPPVSWVHASRDGALWVRIAQPGAPIPEGERDRSARSFVREPVVFDLFRPDGRVIGQVSAPGGLQLQPFPVFDEDRAWAVVTDVAGVPYVARHRADWEDPGGWCPPVRGGHHVQGRHTGARRDRRPAGRRLQDPRGLPRGAPFDPPAALVHAPARGARGCGRGHRDPVRDEERRPREGDARGGRRAGARPRAGRTRARRARDGDDVHRRPGRGRRRARDDPHDVACDGGHGLPRAAARASAPEEGLPRRAGPARGEGGRGVDDGTDGLTAVL